jgi:pSer/pThr/pTyr-binding forkhead associated (FHA) protein
MDYRFRKLTRSPLFISDEPAATKKLRPTNRFIVTFGREGYSVNDIEVPGSSSISRRHCVVINCRNDVWLYDLASTGTYVNGERVQGKLPLIGRNVVRIGNKEFVITSDKDNLI